jgi:hypothetical protein
LAFVVLNDKINKLIFIINNFITINKTYHINCLFVLALKFYFNYLVIKNSLTEEIKMRNYLHKLNNFHNQFEKQLLEDILSQYASSK